MQRADGGQRGAVELRAGFGDGAPGVGAEGDAGAYDAADGELVVLDCVEFAVFVVGGGRDVCGEFGEGGVDGGLG